MCCGEGSYGSEGFFGQLDEQKNLVWVVYLENSNFFVDVPVRKDTATFTSSAGTLIVVNLGTREFGTGSAEPTGLRELLPPAPRVMGLDVLGGCSGVSV